MNTRSTARKKKKKLRKWVRVFFISLSIILMGIGIAGYSFYSDIVSAVDKMNKPISREVSEKRDEKVEVVEQDPFSMLIVGIDEREGDSGRTDSMIVMTINPENKSTKINRQK